MIDNDKNLTAQSMACLVAIVAFLNIEGWLVSFLLNSKSSLNNSGLISP